VLLSIVDLEAYDARLAAFGGVAMVGSSPHRIGKSDAQHHIVVIQRVLGASDDAERDAALVEGFARFGMGLLPAWATSPRWRARTRRASPS
jgi:hypothetical protein